MLTYLFHALALVRTYTEAMSEKAKDAQDRGQTEAESALARESLFHDLKQAAQKGREDRGGSSSSR